MKEELKKIVLDLNQVAEESGSDSDEFKKAVKKAEEIAEQEGADGFVEGVSDSIIQEAGK
jgi:hypothetical protein